MKTTIGTLAFILAFIALGILIMGLAETNRTYVLYSLITFVISGVLFTLFERYYWRDRAKHAEKQLSDIYTKRMTLH
jgi:membrane protein implicated in regulation of membrane protease activity